MILLRGSNQRICKKGHLKVLYQALKVRASVALGDSENSENLA